MEFNFWPFKKRKFMASCGHETYRVGTVTHKGETRKLKIPIVNGKAQYCHKCIEEMTVICAWCKKPIFIGDFITLYSIESGFMPPFKSVIYSKNPLTMVGCERTHCADTRADYCGIWIPPGKVYKMMSAVEMGMASGSTVISNTSNGKIDSVILKSG